jgi:hypothetical protein
VVNFCTLSINAPFVLTNVISFFVFPNTATHEVILTSGDILFYESSKCFHGRPRPFRGSWYSSVFVHYSPVHGYKENFSKDHKVIAIPPGWDQKGE